VIPDEVAKLLARSVKTVWALELLLFLRQHAQDHWSTQQLSTELRSSRGVVHSVLPILIRDGLVTEGESDRFRYAAKAEVDAVVAQLELLYKERPVTIVRAIALASESQIQGLADAFRFRKD
jgi:hypothetical protein